MSLNNGMICRAPYPTGSRQSRRKPPDPVTNYCFPGVELLNAIPIGKGMVTLRSVLEGESWKANRMELPLALGKEVNGQDLVVDLAQAPHLLVAGCTGSGKSVCLNAILAGLLMRCTPADLKLILIDPRRIEFPSFNNLPHLLAPVITDPQKAECCLRWMFTEMDRRCQLLKATGQSNIVGYNSRAQPTSPDPSARNATESKSGLPSKLPYIVIVIDEVADLMIVVGQEFETVITRLARRSQAVGIHMVLTTQRPSINVITDAIKVNFPARIAFEVAQISDSRIILGTSGAEMLIGRGDMLLLDANASRLVHAQGAFVDMEEIARLTKFVEHQAAPVIDQSLLASLQINNRIDTNSTPV